jgi:ATP-dependent RNA helicase HelY
MSSKQRIAEAKERFLHGVGAAIDANFSVDDFQREAIDAITAGQDTLVVAPTGSGKTFIAIEGIKAMLRKKQRCVYTTPLKALSNTKYAEFQFIFGSDHRVGILTGDRKIEGSADVVVATTEIYRNELYRGLDRYALIILDEVHFIADPQRGPVWEESIILTPSTTTLLMLSASISNAAEIAAWIEEVRGKPCRVVTKKERPVELRFGFLHPELGVLPLEQRDGRVFDEVASFYGSLDLDAGGTRLRGGRFNDRGGPPRRGGGRSDDRGGFRGPRGSRGNRGNRRGGR